MQFSYQTPADCPQLWLCKNTLEWYDFNAIRVFDPTWSPGWSNPKTLGETKINTTESISNKPRILYCPIVRVLRWEHFAICITWRRHQMELLSASLALCAGNSPVPGDFPSQRPETRSFNIFFDLRLNILLSKQSWCRSSKTPSRSLWRHCNEHNSRTASKDTRSGTYSRFREKFSLK